MNNPQSGNPLLQPFVNKYEAPPFDLIQESHFNPAIETLHNHNNHSLQPTTSPEQATVLHNCFRNFVRNGAHLKDLSKKRFA